MRQVIDIKKLNPDPTSELVSISRFKHLYYLSSNKMILPSLDLELLRNFKAFLLSNSSTIQLDNKYFRRPDTFCLDTYGSIDYYFIILYINDMFSFSDFSTNTIKKPTKEAISAVVNQIQRKNQPVIYVDKEVTI